MGNWQKIATKMIGDDVGGTFASNIGIATLSETFDGYTSQAQLDANWQAQGATAPLTIRANFVNENIDWDFVRPNVASGQRNLVYDMFAHGKVDGPFGSLPSDGNWAIRWQMVFASGLTAPTTNTNFGTAGLFDTLSTSSNAAQIFIAYQFSMDSGGTNQIALVTGNAAAPDSPTTTDAFTKEFSSDETLYFELKRTSATTIEGTIYSDADYSVIIEKLKITGIASAIIDLRYWRIMNKISPPSDGFFRGTMDELELFNESEGHQNFFTVKGNDKTPTYDIFADLITGEITAGWVADLFNADEGWQSVGTLNWQPLNGWNQLLIDADGGQDEVRNNLNAHVLTPTNFSDDFTTDLGWVFVGTRVALDLPTHLDATNDNATFKDQGSLDIGFNLSDTAWVMRMKLDVTTFTQGTILGGLQVINFLLSDSAADVETAQDFLGWRWQTTDVVNRVQTLDGDNLAPSNIFVGVVDQTGAALAVQTYYVQLKRLTAGTYQVEFFTNSDFSGLIQTVTGTVAATVVDLRFIKIQTFNGISILTQGDGTMTVEIDDIEIWDGVTTPFIDTLSDTAWVCRGSINIADFLAGNSSDKRVFIGMFETTGPPTSSQDSIFFTLTTNSALGNKHGEAAIGFSDNSLPQNATLTPFTYDFFNPMLEGRFFFELKRLSSTEMECTLFGDSGFTEPLETLNLTIPATLVDLAFVKATAIISAGSGRITAYWDSVSVWDGVANVCTFNTTPVLEQDTAQARLNYCNSSIFYSGIEDNSNDAISVDLGATLSDSAFVFRCRINVVDNNVAASSDPFHWIGLFDLPSSTDGSTVQSGIALRADPITGNYQASEGDDSIPATGWTNSTVFADLSIINGIFWLEIARLSSTDVRVTVFSDEDFNDVIESRTFVVDANLNDLRYFAIKNRVTAASTAFWEIIVTDIQVWDAANVADGFTEKTILEIFTTGNQVSGVQNGHYHMNSDAQTGHYVRRNEQNNAGGPSTSEVETFLRTGVTNFSESFMDYLKMDNQKALAKYSWGEKTWNGGDGVAFAPNRVEHCGQWFDEANQRINKIHVFNEPANGALDTDSNIIVFGTDGDVDLTGFFVESGTFTKVTSPTTTQSVFLSFQPKGIIFFGYHDDLSDADISGSGDGFIGFVDDANNNRGSSWATTNAVVSTECLDLFSVSQSILFPNALPSPTFFGVHSQASVALTATGFDVTWNTQDSVASRVHFIAFGGSDITGVQAGDVNKVSTVIPVTQSVSTDVDCRNAVEGEAVAFLCYSRTGPGFGIHTEPSVGIATKAAPSLENGLIAHYNNEGGGNQSRQEFNSAQWVRGFSTISAMLEDEGVFGGFDSAGFDIDWGPLTTSQSPRMIFFIIKGGKWQSGNETARTTTGNRATLTNFQPKGLFTMSLLRTTEGDDTIRESRNPGFGSADGTRINSASMTDEFPQNVLQNLGVMGSTTHIVRYNNPTNQALLAESNLVAFNPTNFTLDWTTVDGNPYKFYWLVCG